MGARTGGTRAGRPRRPFAEVQKWRAGWYAVGQEVCSGPWAEQGQAEHVAHLWNQATELKGTSQ